MAAAMAAEAAMVAKEATEAEAEEAGWEVKGKQDQKSRTRLSRNTLGFPTCMSHSPIGTGYMNMD